MLKKTLVSNFCLPKIQGTYEAVNTNEALNRLAVITGQFFLKLGCCPIVSVRISYGMLQ